MSRTKAMRGGASAPGMREFVKIMDVMCWKVQPQHLYNVLGTGVEWAINLKSIQEGC